MSWENFEWRNICWPVICFAIFTLWSISKLFKMGLEANRRDWNKFNDFFVDYTDHVDHKMWMFENKMKKAKDKYFGRDEYHNPVVVCSKKDIIGQEKRVLIRKFSQHTIYGELINTDKFLAA